MSDLRGRIGAATFGLLTVTTEEAAAITSVFGLHHNLQGSSYFVTGASASSKFEIVHSRIPHQTNIVSVQSAGALIEDFRPEFLLLIGTAGGHSGRDKLDVGDVVVADYMDYAGYWKYSDGAILERKLPHDHPSAHLLLNYVEPLRAKPDPWIDRISVPRPVAGRPKLMVGGMVSANILLGDPENEEQKRILGHFDKAYAFEMEGHGVASAVYRARTSVHYNPQFLIIRGISDLVDKGVDENQATRQLWTPYAVDAAAAFALILIEAFFRVGKVAV